VAAGLATAAADCTSQPVLLIDADARYRRVARRFGLNGSPGWREVIAGTADAESCVHRSKEGRLAVMTSGGKRIAAVEQRRELNQQGQLEEIKSEYGLVVVDMPPAAEFDAPPSSEWLDEMVLVVEAERTRTKTAQRIKDSLERAGVRVAGVVLANTREHIPGWLGGRH
jgi:Mrp family chromosome partitioning ATPase